MVCAFMQLKMSSLVFKKDHSVSGFLEFYATFCQWLATLSAILHLLACLARITRTGANASWQMSMGGGGAPGRTCILLDQLGKAMILASTGPTATACVSDRCSNEYFLVVAGPVATTTAAAASLRARIEQLLGCGRVKSVDQLNRRLQARMGWGDVGLGELAQPALLLSLIHI